MGSVDKPCSCGATQRAASVEVGVRRRCASCGAESQGQEVFDLTRGELPIDLTPYRRRARHAISSSETMEVLADTPLATSRTSDLGRIPLGETTPVTPAAPTVQLSLDSDEQPELPVGTVLGTFTVEETLGKGGMGIVYKAHDSALDRHVALKVLSPTLSRNATFIERFRREAVACGKLSHPNITHIYSISGPGEALHYFAMEFVDGQNLAERVKEAGPFPLEKALEIVRQTALGLMEAAAARIIHRDIKPSNLLLTPGGQVKITDFGLAKAKAAMGHTLDLTSTGVVMGTPLYMSPEQGRGGTVDHRSDIYSLGATLFFLVFGCPPFEADSAIALILKHINDPVSFPADREVSTSLKELLLRMLHKSLNRRLQTYDELLEALDTIRRGEVLHEATSRRVIVLTQSPRRPTQSSKRKSGIFSSGGLKATKLSVARTNIKLGRREKAVSLLRETVREGDPGLRAAAALLLLSLFEKENDDAGVREMAEIVLLDPPDSSAGAYAAWKLATLDERVAVDASRKALERYRAILADAPEEFPREVLEAQVKRLEAHIQDAERESSLTQVVLRERK